MGSHHDGGSVGDAEERVADVLVHVVGPAAAVAPDGASDRFRADGSQRSSHGAERCNTCRNPLAAAIASRWNPIEKPAAQRTLLLPTRPAYLISSGECGVEQWLSGARGCGLPQLRARAETLLGFGQKNSRDVRSR
jgi:hypothetical protein